MTGQRAAILPALLLGLAFPLLSCAGTLHSKDRFTGYFSPVLTPEGDAVLYVLRETEGVSWGAGWEHFTPPAHARISSDRFSLRRHDLATGRDEEMLAWPESPLAGKEIRSYRGRIFTIPHVRLRYHREGHLEFEVSVYIPGTPASAHWRVVRRWDEASGSFTGSDQWREERHEYAGYPEDAMRDSREVVAVPGPESFPSAIVMIDHDRELVTFILKASSFERHYPDGLPERVVFERSHRREIERLRALRRAYDENLRRFLDEGIPEGQARLLTNREMQRMGYYPKPTTLVARRIDGEKEGDAAGDVPTFEITATEFRVGLFRDIDEALRQPGTPVEKSRGRYIRHRDYSTSGLINEYLDGGGRVFRVRTGGETFELTIVPPEGAAGAP